MDGLDVSFVPVDVRSISVVLESSKISVVNVNVQLYNDSPNSICEVSCALKSLSPIDLIIAERMALQGCEVCDSLLTHVLNICLAVCDLISALAAYFVMYCTQSSISTIACTSTLALQNCNNDLLWLLMRGSFLFVTTLARIRLSESSSNSKVVCACSGRG